jgi:hypothetical protein
MLVALLLDALDDLDRALQGLSDDDAARQADSTTPIAWTLGHIGQHLDSWVAVALAQQPKNEYLGSKAFSRGAGGAVGEDVDWQHTQTAVHAVIGKSRTFLLTANDRNLGKAEIYTGSVAGLQGKPARGFYRLARLVAHVYYHIGDITAVRAKLGHRVQDFPSALPKTLAASQ